MTVSVVGVLAAVAGVCALLVVADLRWPIRCDTCGRVVDGRHNGPPPVTVPRGWRRLLYCSTRCAAQGRTR